MPVLFRAYLHIKLLWEILTSIATTVNEIHERQPVHIFSSSFNVVVVTSYVRCAAVLVRFYKMYIFTKYGINLKVRGSWQ